MRLDVAAGDDAPHRILIHDALTDIPGVQVVSLTADTPGSGVVFDFQDADGDDYFGVVAPGLHRIVSPHPSAGFESLTVVPAQSRSGDDEAAEDAEWIRRNAAQAVRNTAAQRTWETLSGQDLPDDQAFTVHTEPDGTVRAELLVSCDGFDAELVLTRRRDGAHELEVRMSDDSPYVPPHLRTVVQAGLVPVVSLQTGEPVEATAARMDQAAFRTLQSRVYRGT